MMKVFPLDGNDDLLHVCWSVSQQMNNADRRAITHICHPNGKQTLCGASTKRGRLPWEYEIWSLSNDGWGVESVGCIRCKRSRDLAHAGGPLETAVLRFEYETAEE